MKIICEKESLERALLPVSKLVSTRTTLPILENVLIEAKDQQLKLVVTDLEIGMERHVQVQVEDEGAATVPARAFSEIIANLDDNPLEILLQGPSKHLEVRGKGFQYKFNVSPADEFPLLPEVVSTQSIHLSQKLLREMVRDTIFAAAPPGDVNVALTGVFLRVSDGVLTMAATDGRRLAKRVASLEDDKSVQASFIVPVRALAELGKILGENDEPVEIMLGTSQILFKGRAFSFFSRLIDGQFPPFENVIPRDTVQGLKLQREELLSALRRAVVLAQERESPKLVKLHAKGGKLIITANTQDLGQAYEEVPIEGKVKDEIIIAFNAKFLIDVLGTLSSQSVMFELSQPAHPGIVRPTDRDDYLYVIMPVRTSQ